MDSIIYANKANQANPSPFLNKPIDNTPKNCVLIYLSGAPDVINLLHDRIKMIAKDGFIMGMRGSNIAIIEQTFNQQKFVTNLHQVMAQKQKFL